MNWCSAPLKAVVKHLVEGQHPALRTQLAALAKEAGAIAHGDLERLIHRLKSDLELQMRKEEAIVFPAILQLDSQAPREYGQFGSIANLSRQATMEHERSARILDEIRRLTDGYTCPPEAGAAARTFFEKLAVLDVDLRGHFRIENEVLFLRAVQLEREENTRGTMSRNGG